MSSDPRRKRADAVNSAKREMILAGARAVFEADGLDGASMRAIAEAAGLRRRLCTFISRARKPFTARCWSNRSTD